MTVTGNIYWRTAQNNMADVAINIIKTIKKLLIFIDGHYIINNVASNNAE